jgi:hypothetical protein
MFRLEPFGPRREEFRSAVQTAAIINTRAFPGEGAEPCYPWDVFPHTLGELEPELSPADDAEQQVRIARAYATA